MMSAPIWTACHVIALTLLLATTVLATTRHNDESTPPLTASEDAVRRHAFDIFNAVHSAMRQWGSSLNHNGMSLFLATVPAGQLFYHGGFESERVKGLNGSGAEWLAFEVEHAQLFASSSRRGRRAPDDYKRPLGKDWRNSQHESAGVWDWDSWLWSRPGPALSDGTIFDSTERNQKMLSSSEAGTPNARAEVTDPWPELRGYFHTYRANRPLNLLYIDGMSAGNSDYGCIDTQDLLLLDWSEENNHHGVFGSELVRATDLCKLSRDWAWSEGVNGHIDGFIRTEAGYEIIYCDFSEGGGLDLVSIQSSPVPEEAGSLPDFPKAEFLRGVSGRYHGQPSGRIHVDWSSMVSAFFYDVNLTNPDASRPELPRLTGTLRDERRGMRARLREVVAARGGWRGGSVVDWQGVVDLIVTRYSGRLDQIDRSTSLPIAVRMRQILPTLLNPYVNYSDPSQPRERQLARCAQHYLSGALAQEDSWTPEDRLIYSAIKTVTQSICSSLYAAWDVLYHPAESTESADTRTKTEIAAKITDAADSENKAVRGIVNGLMGKLQWTTWKECSPCQNLDELCLVAMFPWGDVEDHFYPRCRDLEDLTSRNGYWRMRG